MKKYGYKYLKHSKYMCFYIYIILHTHILYVWSTKKKIGYLAWWQTLTVPKKTKQKKRKKTFILIFTLMHSIKFKDFRNGQTFNNIFIKKWILSYWGSYSCQKKQTNCSIIRETYSVKLIAHIITLLKWMMDVVWN